MRRSSPSSRGTCDSILDSKHILRGGHITHLLLRVELSLARPSVDYENIRNLRQLHIE